VRSSLLLFGESNHLNSDMLEYFIGSLDTLRHVKKDITEARKGSECGMAMDGFSGFQEGDKIQSFEQTERPGQL